MSTPSFPGGNTPRFAVLSDRAVRRLHAAALGTLANVGVVVQHEQAVELLHSVGCSVNGSLVKTPPELVEEAIRLAPSSVPVYNRLGGLQMQLEGHNVYYGTGGSCPYAAEIDGTRTPFTTEQCAKNVQLTDTLDQLDFYMAMAHCSDAPVAVRDVHEVATVLANTTKPSIITSHTRRSLDVIVEMCKTVSGSTEAFRSEPYLIYYTEPVSPLQHSAHSVDKLLCAVEHGLPILNTPAPMAGATAPITLIGTLLTGLAELLSGLVLIQNYRKNSPVIFGGVLTTLDMKGMTFTYGSPELQLMNAAIADMSRHYELPSFGTAGATDSHEVDVQTAFECGTSIVLNALSGSNLVHDVGWMSGAQAISNELMVLCDEMIGYARRCRGGIDIDLLDRSAAELADVGPGGTFIDREFTFELYLKEQWHPALMNRVSHTAWLDSDRTPLNTRLKARTDQLLAEHRPPEIAAAEQREIQKIIGAYDAEMI